MLSLASLYTLFAVLATIVNLVTQDSVVRLYDGAWAIQASILAGTITGLVCKYLLDKRYIFRFRSASVVDEGRVFFLYVAASVVTTLIFWLTEYAFHVLYGTATARYVGACLGLAVGYIVKYQLDLRYAFRRRPD